MVSTSPSQRCLSVTHRATGSGIQTNIGSHLMVPPVADHNFFQVSMLPPSDLHPTVEESMVGEQVKMLSYKDYALAVGLHSAAAMGTGAADSADCAHEIIQSLNIHTLVKFYGWGNQCHGDHEEIIFI